MFLGRWPWWGLMAPLMLVGVVSARWLGPVMPSCLFYQQTGFLCPGCGATRAAVALGKGRWMEAMGGNGLFVMGVVVGGVWIVLSAMGRRFPGVRWLRVFQWRLWFLWVLLGLLTVFGVMRNLSGMGWMKPERSEFILKEGHRRWD